MQPASLRYGVLDSFGITIDVFPKVSENSIFSVWQQGVEYDFAPLKGDRMLWMIFIACEMML